MSSEAVVRGGVEEEVVGKKKRWSLGGFFRRKTRKAPVSESSSEEEGEGVKLRGFLSRRKKSDRGSKDVTGLFVINQVPKIPPPESPRSFRGHRTAPDSPRSLREPMNVESSSEGGSSQTGGSLRSRRTRGARTERYMRRMSKEIEEKGRWTPSPAGSPRAPRRPAFPSPVTAVKSISYESNMQRIPPPPPPRRPQDPSRPLSYAFEEPSFPPVYPPRAFISASEQQVSTKMYSPPAARRRPTAEEQLFPNRIPNSPPSQRRLINQLGQPARPPLVNVDQNRGGRMPRIKPVQDASQFWKKKDQEGGAPPSPKLNGYVPRFQRADSTSSGESLPRRKDEDTRPLSIVMEKAEQSDMENWRLKPPTPPERRSSRQNSASSSESKKPANLEDALHELEAIYQSLNLGDDDLMEDKTSRSFDSDSGMPLKTDDMAYRRMNKKELNLADQREIVSRAGSYLLVSPALSPPPILPTPASVPDITYDDLVFRSIQHSNNTLKIMDPQPPFGIPLGPISPAPESDYLHTTPRPIENKPSKTPDIVMDDLAFRNLRKDSKEVSLKKRKAVRSMSENLTTMIRPREVNNNTPPPVFTTDETIKLAQRVLESRRREQAAASKVKETRSYKDDLRRKFFESIEESQLLQKLEDDARATSSAIDQELLELDRANENDSQSVAELLEELKRSLDVDFECVTCQEKDVNCNPIKTDNVPAKSPSPPQPKQRKSVKCSEIVRRSYHDGGEAETSDSDPEDCVERCDQPTMVAPTHNMNDGREERVARYKEERRRQLAAQFGSRETNNPSACSFVRSTRTSRLRSQANSTQDYSKRNRLSNTAKQDEDYCNGYSPKGDKSLKSKPVLNKIAATPLEALASNTVSPGPQSGDRWRRSSGGAPVTAPAAPMTKAAFKSPSPSPIPKSAQLVKKHLTKQSSERGSNSESEGSSGSLRAKKVSPQSSPASSPNHRVFKTTTNRSQAFNPAPSPLYGQSGLTGTTPNTSDSTGGSGKLYSLPSSPAKHPHSILKKSSLDEGSHHPVSILKRKPSQEENVGRSGSPATPTSADKKGRGILKKHRSLDDSKQEPNAIQNGVEECKPILKSPSRRCSLEEVIKAGDGPQGILKRKTSRDEGIESGGSSHSPEPQGILKRKSSPSNITAAELAFRSVAESLHDLDSHVRPILKKDHGEGLGSPEPTPRPILKKKSSSEEEELTVRPILKSSRRQDEECTPGMESPTRRPILKHPEDSPVSVTLRSRAGTPESPVNRWSLDGSVIFRRPKSPLALDMARPRPLSVAERVQHLQSHVSETELKTNSQAEKRNVEIGGLQRKASVSEKVNLWAKMEKERTPETSPKASRQTKTMRIRNKADQGRFNTQPVTQDEVEMAKKNSPLELSGLMKNLSQKSCGGLIQLKPAPPVESDLVTSNGYNKEIAFNRRRPSSSSRDESSSSSSSSEDEDDEVKNIIGNVRERYPEDLLVKKTNSNIGGGDDDDEGTSSSGGREVYKIMHKPSRGEEFHKRMLRVGEAITDVSSIRRSATQPIPNNHHDETDDAPPTTIAQRLAALEKNGQLGWRRRVTKPTVDEQLPPQAKILADRVGSLETAALGWKSRVAPSDSHQFTVAGKMTPPASPTPTLGSHSRTPAPRVFSGTSDSAETTHSFIRSLSLPNEEEKKSRKDEVVEGPSVTIPNICNDDFTSFFSTPNVSSLNRPSEDAIEIDFGDFPKHSSSLLVHKKTVRIQRNHRSRNPLKALAQREDLRREYTEVKSGVAERELKRINIDKLARSSGLALEALAGLASKENIRGVKLKPAAESQQSWAVAQWKHPLLLRVKGRRHPVTTIVRPHYSTVNQGDAFILVTNNQVYHWLGEYCNVIEKSRSTEIALEIQSRKDLGCTGANQVVTLQGCSTTERHKQFWKLLGLPDNMLPTYKGENAGHPDEDEVYEAAVAETYVVYSLTDNQLIPVQEYWGKLPKYELLDASKVLVFDFDSEIYTWGGKNTELSQKKRGATLAKDLRKTRQVQWVPTDIEWLDKDMSGTDRPEWSHVCKVTQHMEPVLFREKFADWPPEITPTLQSKIENGSVEISPCSVEEIMRMTLPEPDFVMEGSRLGRGTSFYDEESYRLFEVQTIGVKGWKVEDGTRIEVSEESLGHFRQTESYIIKWDYRICVCGRELSGQVSKHGKVVGRDRTAVLVWQGKDADNLEQGAAALLAVEEEAGSGHIVLRQGAEPPAVKNALPGPLVIHYHDLEDLPRKRLFLCTGEVSSEASLLELPSTSFEHFRSKASLWLLDLDSAHSYLWHGCAAPQRNKKTALEAVEYLQKTKAPELGLRNGKELTFEEINEDEEPSSFLPGIRENRDKYASLLGQGPFLEKTPLMYHLSSMTGEFKATLIPSVSYHPEHGSVFPYTQEELYSVSQPGLILLDVGGSLWIWQGWCDEDVDMGGSTWVRYQAERRAAMTTALQLWTKRGASDSIPQVFLVWAGLEPPSFTSLFPTWTPNSVAAEFNLKEGHAMGVALDVQEELQGLTKSKYPAKVLQSHPLPAGVDPTRLELYLENEQFKEVLGVTSESFMVLPHWKQTELKKKAGLF